MKIRTIAMLAFLATSILFGTSSYAGLLYFSGTLGPEVTGATGSGSTLITFDEDTKSMRIQATFSGLSGLTNNAHIHCCVAVANSGTAAVAVATGGILPGFPLGVSAGTYDRTIDMTSTSNYSASFLAASGGTAAGAMERILANMANGFAYLNIHSTTFISGEIRAFLTQVRAPQVPEPATLSLLGLGMLATAAARRRRRV